MDDYVEMRPPFTKRNLGAALWGYAGVLDTLCRIAADNGCRVVKANDAFVLCRVIGDGVRLVVYPHRTSAWNYHLRIRDEGSKNPSLALDLSDKFDAAAGVNCSLQMNSAGRMALRKRAEAYRREHEANE